MKPLTNTLLQDGLSPQAAVRITTEVNALKEHQLRGIHDHSIVWDYAWNKSRLLVEYRGGRATAYEAFNRTVMNTFKFQFPSVLRILGKGRWYGTD